MCSAKGEGSDSVALQWRIKRHPQGKCYLQAGTEDSPVFLLDEDGQIKLFDSRAEASAVVISGIKAASGLAADLKLGEK